MNMGAGFGMHGDDIGPGGGEIGDIGIDRTNHQMHVEGQVTVAAHSLDHVRPERQIGHEMTIHHIEMDVIGAGVGDRPDFSAQTSEISGENRGGDTDRLLHIECRYQVASAPASARLVGLPMVIRGSVGRRRNRRGRLARQDGKGGS